MGTSHSQVVNKTHKKLCVLTFDHADLIYNNYRAMYIIEPGESTKVEALTSPMGLKVAIVYDAGPENQELFYHRWECKNDSVLTVTYMNGSDISTFGDNTTSMGKSKVKDSDESKFAAAIEALTYQPPITRAAKR